MMADKLGLDDFETLRPVQNALAKVVTFVPEADLDGARRRSPPGLEAWATMTMWVWQGPAPSGPRVGQTAHWRARCADAVSEARPEVVVERWNVPCVVSAMLSAHPYDRVAHDIVWLENGHPTAGAVELVLRCPARLARLRGTVEVRVRRPGGPAHGPAEGPIRTVALCGGTGSFLLPDAIHYAVSVPVFRFQVPRILRDGGPNHHCRHRPCGG